MPAIVSSATEEAWTVEAGCNSTLPSVVWLILVPNPPFPLPASRLSLALPRFFSLSSLTLSFSLPPHSFTAFLLFFIWPLDPLVRLIFFTAYSLCLVLPAWCCRRLYKGNLIHRYLNQSLDPPSLFSRSCFLAALQYLLVSITCCLGLVCVWYGCKQHLPSLLFHSRESEDAFSDRRLVPSTYILRCPSYPYPSLFFLT